MVGQRGQGMTMEARSVRVDEMNAEITEGDTVAVSGGEYVYVRGNGD